MKISDEVIPESKIKKQAKDIGKYIFVFEVEVG